MTTTPASGDRETEEAIRQRIAEEVRDRINMVGMVRGHDSHRRQGYVEGLRAALRIIERGTGVAGEGERT